VKGLLAQIRRVADRRLARRFVALAVVSVIVSFLDIAGIAMLVPLAENLAGDAGEGPLTLPVVSGLSTTALLCLAVGFFVAKSLAMAGLRWWAVGAIEASSSVTATRLFAAYMAAPMGFHDERNSATSIRAVTMSVQALYQYGFTSAASGVAEAATLVVLAGFVFVMAPIPALAGALYLGLAALIFLRVLQPRTRRMATRAQETAASAVLAVNEGLGGLREHRVRGSEAGLVESFRQRRLDYALAQRFMVFAGELPRYYLEVLVLGGFGVVALVVIAVTPGPEALGVLVVLLAVVFRILPALSRLLATATSLRIGEAALRVIVSDLDAMGIDRLATVGFGEVDEDSWGSHGDSTGVPLEVFGATFRYGASPAPALAEVTLEVPAGGSLGVVGPSGAGKSTLIDVLCGLRPLEAGEVRVGGERLDPPSSNRMTRVGLVPQDVYLSDASIRRNVAFGAPEHDHLLWEALERARIADFVRSLPDGVDTVVGERGARLSGGQRQRIGIARALYGNPGVLILDEATSSLDAETESEVVRAIAEMAGSVTLVVVAHRLSTIRHCDRIVYLEDGRVRALGTFDEVVADLPQFARAVEIAGLGAG